MLLRQLLTSILHIIFFHPQKKNINKKYSTKFTKYILLLNILFNTFDDDLIFYFNLLIKVSIYSSVIHDFSFYL